MKTELFCGLVCVCKIIYFLAFPSGDVQDDIQSREQILALLKYGIAMQVQIQTQIFPENILAK